MIDYLVLYHFGQCYCASLRYLLAQVPTQTLVKFK